MLNRHQIADNAGESWARLKHGFEHRRLAYLIVEQELERQRSLPQSKAGPRNHSIRGVSGRRRFVYPGIANELVRRRSATGLKSSPRHRAGDRDVPRVEPGLSVCVGSGIHPAINGEIRAGNVRGLRTGDERHQRGDLIKHAHSGRALWRPSEAPPNRPPRDLNPCRSDLAGRY